MKAFIGNAFSLNMVGGDATVEIRDCAAADVPSDATSCIGHEATASVVSQLLGREVPMNRIAVSLASGDTLYACSLTQGGRPYRAPEGVVLGEDDLASLEIGFRKVTVL